MHLDVCFDIRFELIVILFAVASHATSGPEHSSNSKPVVESLPSNTSSLTVATNSTIPAGGAPSAYSDVSQDTEEEKPTAMVTLSPVKTIPAPPTLSPQIVRNAQVLIGQSHVLASGPPPTLTRNGT
ncbi:hypothetical protein Ciccas_002865 [Cichlidogyrus casuarinus]|uniref:Uncharacterized protein n=1 Tax=Cichlidogyrus casuarinus TaxID=1844966 RepID=A0ABD2QG80_9PLAT